MTDHGGAASPRTEAMDALVKFAAYLLPDDMPVRAWVEDAIKDGPAKPLLALIEAAQEAPAPEGLRERIAAILDGYRLGDDRPGWVHPEERWDLLDEIEAALAATPPTPAEPPRPTHAYATSATGSWYCCLPPGHEGDHGNYLHPDADLTGGPTCQALFPVRAEARPPEGLAEAWIDTMAALSGGSDFSLSFAANGPEAGWYATALRPAMSAHEIVGPVETAELALLALAARLSAGGATKLQPGATVGNRPDVATPRVAKATRGAKGAR